MPPTCDMDIFTVQQNIFRNDNHRPIPVIACHEQNLTLEVLSNFLKLGEAGHIGLAPVYDGKCCLSKLAMATDTQVLLVTLLPKAATSSRKSKKSPARIALESIFSHKGITFYAFKMDYVAGALYLDHGIRLQAGKHLLSVSNKKQLDGLMVALGGEMTLNKHNVIDLFRNEASSSNEAKTTALQAWTAYQAATMPHTFQRVCQLPNINTLSIDKPVLLFIYYLNGRFLFLLESVP